MSHYLSELFGTMLLVLLGNGVVANVVLNKCKGQSGGWIVITAGWGFAVTIALYTFGRFGEGHFNPAISIALALVGKLNPLVAVVYVVLQMIGAFVGATLVWLAYGPHWAETPDPEIKRAAFCTSPAIRHTGSNLTAEIIGTAVLMIGALSIPSNLSDITGWSKGFGPFLIGLLVWSIGLSLGGTTGYAINPARDLGPRLAYAFLPVPGKASSDWDYAWIPVVGPIIGAIIGAVFGKIMF